MRDMSLAGGRVITKDKPVMPEITTYPATELNIREGCTDIGDATHYLSVTLPLQGKEIRIPLNARALRTLGRDAQQAGGIAQPQLTETEGE